MAKSDRTTKKAIKGASSYVPHSPGQIALGWGTLLLQQIEKLQEMSYHDLGIILLVKDVRAYAYLPKKTE